MFISFEGMEGSGKGTAIKALSDWLSAKNVPFLVTREPGGTSLGQDLRAILLDSRRTIAPVTELFLYLADRAQHVDEVIRPALKNDLLVITDRYADSTIVYQGYGRGMNVDHLHDLNDAATGALWPDLTILLDVEPSVGLERARKRNQELNLTVSEGRFEAEHLAFHTRVREGYLKRAARYPNRFAIIDANQSPESIIAAITELLTS